MLSLALASIELEASDGDLIIGKFRLDLFI